ncbi:MAG TPA: hypothetical protein VF727_14995 [Allosphingosinicella sp.]|jgi:hypothetical protein
MTKSATDVMQEIVVSSVLDSIAALKAASGGLPNTLLRELNAIHANTTFADLPKELQASIGASVRAAFTRLLKEGYSVTTGQPAPPRPQAPRPDSGPRGPRGPRPPANRHGPGGDKRPRGPGRPGGGGGPGGSGRKPPGR